jgi:hypothetical protein
MPAQIDLQRGREPAQVIPVGPLPEKGGFGEVHLARYVLHPAVVPRRGKHADGRRVAGEGFGGEGVDLVDLHG